MKVSTIYISAAAILCNVPIEFIGTFRLGELILMFYFIINFRQVIRIVNNNVFVKIYTFLTVIWFVLATISSYINGTENIEIIKGMANIFTIYSSLISLFLLIEKNINNAVVFLILYGLGSLFFSPFSYNTSDNINLSVGLNSGYYNNFFDIYAAPVLTPIIIGFSIIFYKSRGFIIILFLFYGCIGFINDGKSTGLIFILSGITLILHTFNIKLTLWKLRIIVICFPFIMTPLLLYIIQNKTVGSKETMSTISQNLKSTKNFNPFLVIARPEPLIGLFAVADSPLLGHGFLKTKHNFIKLTQQLGYLPKNWYYRYQKYGIPAHSNLVHAMIQGGIFCGLVWIFIISKSFTLLGISNKYKFDKFTMFTHILYFYLMWNILFSPILRVEMGFFVAMVFVLQTRITKKFI